MVKETVEKNTSGSNKYSYDEVFSATLDYFGGDELATSVFFKYCLQDKEGNYLEKTPDDMHRRLAREFARIESKYPNPMSEDKIYEYLKSFKYIVPQGSPMAGIGNKYRTQSIGNCFVIDKPFDSYGGILKTDQELAQLMKRRAGVGVCIDNIRPKGLSTDNAAITTDGISVFMERFSNTCREVAQNGRRGAELQCISVHHPEIYTFINIKKDKTKVTGANISVKLTDEFLSAVENNENFQLRWPVDNKKDPIVSKMIDAKKLWNDIIESAWSCVSYDTEIMPEIDGKCKLMKIGDFVKNYESFGECFITSLNLKTQKIEKKRISNAFKYKNTKDCVEVTTKTGGRIKSTNDHIFYKLYDGKIVPTMIKDIVIGDRVVLSSKLVATDSTRSTLNILGKLDYFAKNGYGVVNNKNTLNALNNIPRGSFGKYGNNEKITFFKSAEYIPLKFVKDIIDNKFDFPKDLSITPPRQNFTINSSIHIDDDLAFIIGLFLSEGSAHSSSLRFHINTDEYQYYEPIISRVCEKYSCSHDIEVDGEYTCINLYSAFLKDIIVGFEFVVEEDGNKYRVKSIPSDVFSWNSSQVGRLIDGFISGDGTVSNGNVVISQSNKVLLNSLKSLMLRFGVHSKLVLSKLGGKKVICGKLCNYKSEYRLYIYSNFSHIIKDVIGITHKEKMNAIVTSSNSLLFGCPIGINKSLLSRKLRRGQGNVKNIMRSTIEKYDSIKFDQDIRKYLDGDIFYDEIVGKEEISLPHVYDITVDDNHTYALANGIVISNSAEPGLLFEDNIIKNSTADIYSQVNSAWATTATNPCGEIPMGRDSCRLLLLNLKSFVKDKFTKKSEFDYDLFREKAIDAQRLMDDLIDLEIENIDKILKKIKSDPEPDDVKKIEYDMWSDFKHTCESGRRTGLGITALGDTLAAMGIKYGSEESIRETEKIYKSLSLAAHYSSCILAKERGAFPIFNFKLEDSADCPYIKRVWAADKKILSMSKKYGRRNIALTTTAPAGSVSCMTQTTSGIEPAYLIKYKRRKKVSVQNENTEFTDQLGDQWTEYDVCHHGFAEWSNISGSNDVTKSPYYNATSADINWVNKIKMQAAAQKWVSHSISNTTNLPNTATKKTVSDIYMEAWRSGCKGVTIYRDGSRSGVLVSGDDKGKHDNNGITADASKRGDELECDIHSVSVKGEKWIILVGMMNGRPYEVFGGLSENVEIPSKYKTGIIVKATQNKTTANKYDLLLEDGFKIKNITKMFDNPLYQVHTRMVSLALRHFVSVNFLTEQLQKDPDNSLTSFSKVLARVLKKYITDGTKVSSDKECPECKSNSLVYSEGCKTCVSCSWTACS